jgi:cytochrome c oxidase cbb3-type subunit III
MSDFTSGFWSLYIGVITVVSIVACGVFLKAFTTRRLAPGEKVDTTGHVWDEDLKEWNNPLPNWWRWLFWITLIFSAAYLALFPGLGSFPGVLGWSQVKQYDDEVASADAQYGPIYAKFAKEPIPVVAANAEARQIGERLFLNYCAQCHGSDAKGSRGFPNLTDKQWYWGGEPEMIEASILNGRVAAMPPWPQLSADQTKDVAHYVLSLAGRTSDGLRAQRGREVFQQNCVACHGPDGKGNPQLGARNLTANVWLYGGSEAAIIETLVKGRNGQMPAFKDFLGEAKVHLLAAYVWGLSNESGGKPPAAAAK